MLFLHSSKLTMQSAQKLDQSNQISRSIKEFVKLMWLVSYILIQKIVIAFIYLLFI